MKHLNESKEALPIAFLTNFVSDGWEKVGLLKEQAEAIKREFKGTKRVEGLIQGLIDAYLVCIGQIEQHLADDDYLEFPEEAADESLKEDINVNIGRVVISDPEVSDVEIEHENEAKGREAHGAPAEERRASDTGECAEGAIKECDWFCDFDDPVGDRPTDGDVYQSGR